MVIRSGFGSGDVPAAVHLSIDAALCPALQRCRFCPAPERLAAAGCVRGDAGSAFLLWMGSLKFTSVASSTMIMALEPVFIMLGAYLLYKEKTACPP